MEAEQILELVRGLVRPVALFAIVGGIVGFLAVGKMEEAKLLSVLGGPILGYWFSERAAGKRAKL